jgi:hypothetical protein
MTLANLLGLLLESVKPDAVSIRRLMDASRRSLADAGLESMSNEGRFDMAYKSIMQAANAALQANGYRTLTSKPGHHQTMIQSLPLTIGLDAKTMIILDGLRKQRNVSDYSGDPVSESMAFEAIAHAQSLLTQTDLWIKANKALLI